MLHASGSCTCSHMQELVCMQPTSPSLFIDGIWIAWVCLLLQSFRMACLSPLPSFCPCAARCGWDMVEAVLPCRLQPDGLTALKAGGHQSHLRAPSSSTRESRCKETNPGQWQLPDCNRNTRDCTQPGDPAVHHTHSGGRDSNSAALLLGTRDTTRILQLHLLPITILSCSCTAFGGCKRKRCNSSAQACCAHMLARPLQQ